MEWWLIVLLVLTVVIVLGVLFYLIQFKHEDKIEKLEESKNRIEELHQSLEIVIDMCGDNVKFKNRLIQVQDKILYSSPCNNKNTLKYETKIKNKISELKISLAKAKLRGSYISCERILDEIELLLIERKQNS